MLVVDDEPRNRAIATAILRLEHDVEEASSAAEAYARLEGGGIDLVLLDVMMPGIDGITACREIKARYAEPFLPVLLFTALDDQEHRNLGFEAGADDFLTKPVDRREMLLRVRAFLKLRQQEHLIRRQIAELRRVDRMKDDLEALLVHDLRNPMTGVEGMLHLLHGSATDDDQRRHAEWALMGMAQLRGLVEDMLRVRLIEDAQLPLHRRPANLHELAKAAANALRGEAELRALSIAVEGSDTEVAVDPTLVRRAIENLVANGLRYTAPGTQVMICTRPTPAGGGVIEVADRGPGIPDVRKRELFQRYASLDAKGGRAGHGLGLYMVRLATEAHGGEVAVEDRPGGGTVFRMRLPAEAA